MTLHDVYILSPEISMVALAIIVIGVDITTRHKGMLSLISLIGLAIPITLTILLWDDIDTNGNLIGIFNSITLTTFSLYFKLLILTITFLVIMASGDLPESLRKLKAEFIGLILLSASGMMLLAGVTEFISIYLSIELSTLPLIALSAFLMTSRSSEAGIKFLVLSGISSAILLYGMLIIYGITGTTYLNEISSVIQESSILDKPFGNTSMMLGIILIIAGIGFKVSAVPFHMWVPDVYEGAPTHLIAFLSVASKSIGFAILLKILYIAFPFFENDWSTLFAIMAVASMSIGNIVAMTQTDMKRMLGYSGIAHAGYIMVGIASITSGAQHGGETSGPSSVLFYLAAYSASNLAAFFIIATISNYTKSHKIDDLAGMWHRSPLLSLVLLISLISLIGLPPTGLFIGKIFLFTAAIQSNLTWLAIAGVINSVISTYYYLKPVRVMFMSESINVEPARLRIIPTAAIVITGIIIVALGIAPQILTSFSDISGTSILPLH